MRRARRPSAHAHLVALPGSVDEVLAVLQIAARHGVPVVARGAGTGLSGGALPVEGGILLVLSRLNRILEVDPGRRFARVQPGVTNLSISDAAAPHGLFYAPDPSSQLACTIGGNVAENSGGVHCLKYGLTIHNLLELVVATWDGEQITVGSPLGEAPGLSLLPLLTGSEGMLGVVVEATVRLVPMPERVELLLASFDDVGRCADAVGRIIASGIVPAGLEMMDGPALRAAEAFAHCGYPPDAAAVLLCELDGLEHDVEAQVNAVRDLLTRCGASARAGRCGRGRAARMWSGRKSAFPGVGRLAADYYCMDGTIPRRHRRRSSGGSRRWRTTLSSPWRTSFTPGTATCTRSSCSMPAGPANSTGPSASALTSSSCASPWAAPSPASTAWRREARSDVHAVRGSRARGLPLDQACVRPRGPPEPGQGRPDAGPLRGLRGDARARRQAPHAHLPRF